MPLTPSRSSQGATAAVALGASALLVLGAVSTASALGPEDGDGVIIATESGQNWAFLGADGPNDLSGTIDLSTVAGIDNLGEVSELDVTVAAVEYVTSAELVEGMDPDRDYLDLLVSVPSGQDGFACLIVRADAQSGEVVDAASGRILGEGGDPFSTTPEPCTGLEYIPSTESESTGAYLVLYPSAVMSIVDSETLTVTTEVDIFGSLNEIPVDFHAIAFGIVNDEPVVFLGFDFGIVAVRSILEGGTVVSDEFDLEATVTGLDFDESGNLWVLALPEGDEGPPTVVAFDAADLLELDFEGSPTPTPTLTIQPGSAENGGSDNGGTEGGTDWSDFTLSENDVIEPAAVATPVYSSQLTLDGSSAALRSITAVPSDSVFTAEAELADTGPNDELLLGIGVIAGALLVGGIVITAVGASRRRASRD